MEARHLVLSELLELRVTVKCLNSDDLFQNRLVSTQSIPQAT